MIENIFKDAAFGDKYRTRDGHTAVFIHQKPSNRKATLIIQPEGCIYREIEVNTDGLYCGPGNNPEDITSKIN